MSVDDRVRKVIQAYAEDGWDVDPKTGVKFYQGNLGMVAVHRTATIGRTGQKKKSYYVEGPPHAMGYLMGLLAEPEVSRMCEEFNEKVVLEFMGVKLPPNLERIIGELLENIIVLLTKNIPCDLPDSIKEEINGLYEGCKFVNNHTRVSKKALGVLNYGIDGLLAFVYTGLHPVGRPLPPLIKAEHFRIPLMCNGFSIAGKAVENGGHFMGRDFMFPTAGVFQDTACHIVRIPSTGLPTVSVAAPGMVGSVTALNANGVGGGVDIMPSGACDPRRPGLNSLLLVRHSVEFGATCDDAVDVMEKAHRGVSWGYLLADGSTGKACVVEAGRSEASSNFLAYPPAFMLKYLPGDGFVKAHPTTDFRNGLMVRWSDTTIPHEYMNFNPGLFKAMDATYDPAAFMPDGFINTHWKGTACPEAYYFAPMREIEHDVVLLSNRFVIPEMQLTQMMLWTNELAKREWDNIQWRYDELRHRIATELQHGPINREKAREMINFLDPSGAFPDYYNPDKLPLDQVEVRGATSLVDLKERVLESHFGYYADEWVTTTLPNYLAG